MIAASFSSKSTSLELLKTLHRGWLQLTFSGVGTAAIVKAKAKGKDVFCVLDSEEGELRW